MTRSAEDAALVFNHMLCFDPKDSTSADRPREDYTRHLGINIKGLKIGVPRSFLAGRCSPTSKRPVREALAEDQRLGATLVDISLRRRAWHSVYYVVARPKRRATCRASTASATGTGPPSTATLPT